MPSSNSLLLIEDDSSFAKPVSRNLTARGFDVTTCQTGEDALARLREQYFDLVVTDIRLPGASRSEERRGGKESR